MTALIPRLLTADALPLAELNAMRLDGELFAVADAFATLDTPDTAELRAAAFQLGVPRSAVADRRTASWIHGARAVAPSRVQICVQGVHRGSAAASLRHDIRQAALHHGDTVSLGGARVTTPLRTAIDLLRTETHLTSTVALEVQALLDSAGCGFTTCREKIARHPNSPGTRRALVRLTALSVTDHPLIGQQKISPR